jgi:bacterioferritin-associated ferredoxin
VYVCICNAVTDSDIRRAVDNGVRDIRQLKMETGCSTNCGSCETTAREILDETLRERGPFLTIVTAHTAA